jgi:hypothetical protein
VGSISLPKVLYHYTNQEGFLGIIKDKALWATEIQYMNDASEFILPIKIACDALIEISRKRLDLLGKDAVRSIADPEKEIYIFMNFFLEQLSETNVFVISFSQDGDSLSQWRAYGAPGSAYSIGFNSEKLSKVASQAGFELLQCQYYKKDELEEQIRDIMNEFVEQILEKPAGWRTGYTYDSALRFLKLASKMKHHSFREEKEWRLILSPSSAQKIEASGCRSGKSMIIPYYSLELKPFPLYRIYIGPCPHQELSQRAVGELLLKEKLPLTRQQIKISQTPYRNW